MTSPSITETVSVVEEVVSFPPEGIGSFARGEDSVPIGQEPINPSGTQKRPGVISPAGALGAGIVRAGIGKSGEMLDGMIEVNQFEDTNGTEKSGGSEGIEPLPDPEGTVGDEEDAGGLKGEKQRQVLTKQLKQRLGAAECAVNQRAEGAVESSVRSQRVDVQEKGFAPMGVIAVSALGGPSAGFVLPDTQAAAVDGNDQTPAFPLQA